MDFRKAVSSCSGGRVFTPPKHRSLDTAAVPLYTCCEGETRRRGDDEKIRRQEDTVVRHSSETQWGVRYTQRYRGGCIRVFISPPSPLSLFSLPLLSPFSSPLSPLSFSPSLPPPPPPLTSAAPCESQFSTSPLMTSAWPYRLITFRITKERHTPCPPLEQTEETVRKRHTVRKIHIVR